ncbi:MAG: hypothetical protein ACE1ZK_04850, partial [Nitrospirales bacterium]
MEGEQNTADTNPYAVKTCTCFEDHLVFLKGLLKKLKFFKMKLVFNIFSDQKEREGMFKKHALAEAGGALSKGRRHFGARSVRQYVSTTKGRERRWLVCRSLGEG